MALTINNPVGGSCTTTTTTLPNHHKNHRFPHSSLSLPIPSSRTTTTTHIVSATGNKFTTPTGKFESKNQRKKRSSSTTTTKEQDNNNNNNNNKKLWSNDFENNDDDEFDTGIDDGFVVPELPGDKPDFWEGPQWDALGFFVQYMWAFGVVFALVACGVAVATYNEGATDFRDTPAYKESIQSRDVLEGPEASDSDVFESNPTEEAPALE